MDLGIDPAQLTGLATEAQRAHKSIVVLLVLLAVGAIGRMVFVAWGDKIAGFNPLRGQSGPVLLLVGAALVLGPMFMGTSLNGLWIKAKSHTVEPFVVSVLEQDSCELADESSYCVIMWDKDREIVVNWYNKNIYMWRILNPESGSIWSAPRPGDRPSA